ncbi:MAG: hypothetical protein QOE54_5692 [Streptosporangiaceae bacterium]|jgi:hypothetical protein|nr:hypothetical protein [Streptosporangiaceae bacterium]MDX6433326.1 hypothetical protein [Streptosporangiaceae bacterium]
MNRFALGTVAIAALALTATGCKAGVHVGAGGAASATPATARPIAGTTAATTAGTTPGGSGAGGTGTSPVAGHPSGGVGGSGGTGTVITRCHSAGLHAVVTGYNAGAGSRFAKLLFTNVSGHSCKVRGWPGLGLGTGSEGFGGSVSRQGSPTSFVIPPGGHAYTLLRWSAVPAADESGGPTCEGVPTVLQVIPPDETVPLVAPWSGGPACQHNRLETTPLTAGPGA